MADLTPINATTFRIDYDPDTRVEIGDIRAIDFKPSALVEKWDGECRCRISKPTAETRPVSLLDDKLTFAESTGIETHFYPVADAGGDGRQVPGFEIEVLLPSKPASNVLEFDIETEGLRFFYQPALTQEEIDRGAVRPDHVVGSYAVYHATKRNNRYKAGKAFHIYRPRATDRGGKWTWCELHLDEQAGTLSVTVPQAFLDSAVYPVLVDPTLGVTSAGSSAQNCSRNYIYYSYIGAASSGGALTKIGHFVDVLLGSREIALGLYSGSSSDIVDFEDYYPETLPSSGTDVDLGGAPNGSTTIVTSEDYWVAPWVDDNSAFALCYDSGSYVMGYVGYDYTTYYPAFLDPITGEDYPWSARLGSGYIEYGSAGESVTAAVTLPCFTISATVGVERSITAAVTLPGFTISATVSRELPTITAAVTLPGFTISANVSRALPTITAAVTLPGFTISATVTDIVEVTAAVTLPGFTIDATVAAQQQINVTAAVTLPCFTIGATVGTERKITAAVTLPGFTIAASVAAERKIDAAVTLPGFTIAATVSRALPTIVAAVTLPGFTISANVTAAGAGEVPVTAAVTLPGFTIAATVGVEVPVTAAVTLPGFTIAATVGVEVGVTASVTLPGFTIAATVGRAVDVAAAVTLPGFTISATVLVPEVRSVTAAVTLPCFTISATVWYSSQPEVTGGYLPPEEDEDDLLLGAPGALVVNPTNTLDGLEAVHGDAVEGPIVTPTAAEGGSAFMMAIKPMAGWAAMDLPLKGDPDLSDYNTFGAWVWLESGDGFGHVYIELYGQGNEKTAVRQDVGGFDAESVLGGLDYGWNWVTFAIPGRSTGRIRAIRMVFTYDRTYAGEAIGVNALKVFRSARDEHLSLTRGDNPLYRGFQKVSGGR